MNDDGDVSLTEYDPPRDREIAQAIQYVLAAHPDRTNDMADAIARSVREPSAVTWWGQTANWGTALIPAAVAATIIFCIAVRSIPIALATEEETGPREAAVVAVTTAQSGNSVTHTLIGVTGHDWLLNAAVQR